MNERGAESLVLPQWLAALDEAGEACLLRAFGTCAADLKVEFSFARRPELITRILLQCCRAADGAALAEERLLRMPVSLRMEILLRLAALSDTAPFSWRVCCGSAACGTENEFELSSEQILALSRELRDQETISSTLAQMGVTLRRPTGADQMRWLAEPSALQSESMLRCILVRPSLDELFARGASADAIASGVDEIMDRFDPLLGFHLRVVCPECAVASSVSPDLAGIALERLLRSQRAALEVVHRIASHYHWSEGEILELPAWRRHTYLELIDAGAA